MTIIAGNSVPTSKVRHRVVPKQNRSATNLPPSRMKFEPFRLAIYYRLLRVSIRGLDGNFPRDVTSGRRGGEGVFKLVVYCRVAFSLHAGRGNGENSHGKTVLSETVRDKSVRPGRVVTTGFWLGAIASRLVLLRRFCARHETWPLDWTRVNREIDQTSDSIHDGSGHVRKLAPVRPGQFAIIQRRRSE